MPAKPSWYEHAYRRVVVDTHIPDWDEKFLADFNAETFAERLAQARAQSVVAYAQSHVGLLASTSNQSSSARCGCSPVARRCPTRRGPRARSRSTSRGWKPS